MKFTKTEKIAIPILFLIGSLALIPFASAITATNNSEPTPAPTVTATVVATVTAKPKPRPTVTVTAKVYVTRASRSEVRKPPSYHNWDAVAKCESGGRWSLNSGNGFSGGLQFMQGTWVQAGGTKYASRPYLATRSEQIAVAESWLSKTSWKQWPICGRYL